MTGTETQQARAVVLVSGGLDSATALALAREQGYACYALSIDYGQRHDAELAAAKRIATDLGAEAHKIIRIDLGAIGGSALTDPGIPVPEKPSAGIPVTYVPARNTVFLALALGWAEVLGAEAIFIGVNEVDYSGYPDCREAYLRAFQQMADLATRTGVEGKPIRIHTPLLHMNKAEIIHTGTRLCVDYALTVSCYRADRDGRACGTCDACRLRRAGFAGAGIPDPTSYQ